MRKISFIPESDQEVNKDYIPPALRNVKLAYEREPDRYFPVACRLCGETWSIPRTYEDRLKGGKLSWECPYCKRKWNMVKGKLE